MLEIILGQIPEAIYFSLFMIFTKRLKNKRILFTLIMIIEYLCITHIIKFNLWLQISYTFLTYIVLKILYKEKSQITDIFTFTIGSIVLTFLSFISYIIINFTIKNMIIAAILLKILMIRFFVIFHKKLYSIQLFYKKIWNRKNKNNFKIKTTTFRCLNVVIFNIIFYLLNLMMLYAIAFYRR